MRFTAAWSEVMAQNSILRIALISLGLSLALLVVGFVKVVNREPLIIDRTCVSTVVRAAPTEHTETEVYAFIQETLPIRFDSDARSAEGLLSSGELQKRNQEQAAYAEKQMKQRVVVNRMEKIDGRDVWIDADRILAVGPVRMVLPFRLHLTLASVPRSRGNPYGLMLVQSKPEEGKNAN